MIFKKTITSPKGFTLVEALVGITIFSIVFFGIFGAYRLGLKVIGLSKNRIIATAIANSRIEEIRNLTYESAGVKNALLPMALGNLDQDTVKTINGINFDVETKIKFVMDSKDGVGDEDSCNWDYKKADIAVSWHNSFGGEIIMSTVISPKNAAQEAQTCLNQPGGVLSVTAFDSSGALIPSPLISVYNQEDILVDSAVPDSGKYSFALPVGTYKVEISKADYGGVRTYGSSEIAVPDSPNPAVLDQGETGISLMMDKNSNLSVSGVTLNGHDNFSDTFADESLVSEMENVGLVSGSIRLSGPSYSESGYAISNSPNPADLVAWDYAEFNDYHPASTDISYQILYYDGANWALVPEGVLSGNATGFGSSPIDLSALDKDFYAQLKIKGVLSSSDPSATPEILDWRIAWTNSAGIAVGNAAFRLQGTKTIGTNEVGLKILKYSADYALDAGGNLDIDGIEGDAYTISVDPSQGFSLIGTNPSPQPISAIPGNTVPVKLYLRAQNALQVMVENDDTLVSVFSAAVRLKNDAIGFDKTQYTDQAGQTYFAPIQNGTYDLMVSFNGYTDYSGTVAVLQETSKIIGIHQNE